MSPTLAGLPYTPLQDLLRGQVTARLDWRGLIASSNLAPEVKALVSEVVSQTHLWRSEQAEVAAELLEYFIDGLEAGATDAELIAHFGDPHSAAQMIRLAKIHSRAKAWRLFHFTFWLIAICCVFYAGVGVYYYSGKPSPTVNYLAAVNQRIEATPQDQRAWPIYSSALRASGAEEADSVLCLSPDGEHWPQIARWVDDHESAIESVRQASGLPALGILLESSRSATGSSTGGAALINLPMPQLRDLRVLTDLLSFDAKRAREQGDGRRVERDITALAGLAAQEAHNAALEIGELFSLNVLARSYDELDRTLVEAPQLLNDAALVRIAHRISVPQTGGDLISFAGQRLFFEDVVQRTFTDDGHGDGHISPVGWDFSRTSFLQEPNLPEPMLIQQSPGFVLQPFSLLAMASRKQMLDECDRLMDLNDAMIRVPLREADLNAPYGELKVLSGTISSQWRYALLLAFMPSLQRSAEIAERTLGQRDGLLVGLALEMYRRRHQRYPETLDQLTPDLLPAVSADRITGDPLKYRLIDGKPLVYSVGVDRIDDGGRVPLRNGKPDPTAAARWGNYATVVAGDWVLYPQPRVRAAEMKN